MLQCNELSDSLYSCLLLIFFDENWTKTTKNGQTLMHTCLSLTYLDITDSGKNYQYVQEGVANNCGLHIIKLHS